MHKFGINKSNISNHETLNNIISQESPKGGLIKLSCGGGKCLGFNTEVLLYDGSIKMVQNIIIGDKLMGDDSKPRNVLSITRGREQMYKIINMNDNSYYNVNASHILSLYDKNTNNIIDIELQDYLNLQQKDNLYGYKKVIQFCEIKILFEPYYFANCIFDSYQYLDQIE